MENAGITDRQIKRMVLLESFAAGALFMPFGAAGIASGAVVTMVMGLLAAFVFGGFLIWISVKQGYFKGVQALDGRLIHLLYALRFFLRAVIVLLIFEQMVKRFLLPDSTRFFILFPVVVVGYYACLRTMEGRARLIELLFWWTLVPIFVIWLFSLSGWHIELLQSQSFGAVGVRPGKTVFVVYGMLLFYLPFESILYFMPKAGDTHKDSTVKAAYSGLVLGLLLNLAIFCMAFFVVGEHGLQSDIFSVATMLQMITIPGNVVARLDIIAMPFLVLGLFIIYSGSIFYGCKAWENVLSNKWLCGWKVPALVSLVILIAALFCGSFADILDWYKEYGMWLDLPLAVILPLICLLGTGSKKRKLEMLLLTCMVLFTGCSKVDIEDKDYVLMLGIDAVPGETVIEKETYTFAVAMADMQGYKAEVGESVKMKTAVDSRDSLLTFRDSYSRNHATKMDFGHVKLLLLQEDIVKNTDRLSQLLAMLHEEAQISATVMVAVTQESAVDYIDMDQESELVLSQAIVNMLEKEGNVSITLQDLYRTFGENGDIVLPVLTISKEEELPVIGAYITVSAER